MLPRHRFAQERQDTCISVPVCVCVTRPACKVLCGNARRWGREAKNCWIPPRGPQVSNGVCQKHFRALPKQNFNEFFLPVCVCVCVRERMCKNIDMYEKLAAVRTHTHTHPPGHTWGDAGQNLISILSIRNGSVQRSHSSFFTFISLPTRTQNGKGKKINHCWIIYKLNSQKQQRKKANTKTKPNEIQIRPFFSVLCDPTWTVFRHT